MSSSIKNPDIANSLYSAVGAASVVFADMTAKRYMFSCTTACFIKQASTTPTAAAAAGNMAVSPGQVVDIDPRMGTKLAVIQASAGGHATLTPYSITQ